MLFGNQFAAGRKYLEFWKVAVNRMLKIGFIKTIDFVFA